MVNGQKVTNDRDRILIKLKNLENLDCNFAPSHLWVELEILPWLKYFGHPIARNLKVHKHNYY